MGSTALRMLFRPPVDLLAIVFVTIIAVSTSVLFGLQDSAVRVVFGALFALFVPGYALVAVLFPAEGEASERTTDVEGYFGVIRESRGIGLLERLMLSIGLSVAITPSIGLLLYLGWSFRPVPLLVTLSVTTILLTVIAAYRREALSEEERLRLGRRLWSEASVLVSGDRPRAVIVLNVLLVIGFLLTGASVVYEMAGADRDDSFTEFYLLTETDNGSLVVGDYPTNVNQVEETPLYVGIENQEHRSIEYTVVTLLQETRQSGNDTIVTGETEVGRYSTTVEHNESDIRELAIDVTGNEDASRVMFLLYRVDLPDQPNSENAYRSVHLWMSSDGNRSSESSLHSSAYETRSCLHRTAPCSRPGYAT